MVGVTLLDRDSDSGRVTDGNTGLVEHGSVRAHEGSVEGGGSGTDSPATRLDPQAEAYERQAHLEGQARTHGRDEPAAAPSQDGNDAERDERQASSGLSGTRVASDSASP
jgi:hypothetical protein